MNHRVTIDGVDVTTQLSADGLGSLSLSTEDRTGRSQLSAVRLRLDNIGENLGGLVNSGQVRQRVKIYVPYGLVFDGVVSSDGFELDRDNYLISGSALEYLADVLARAKGVKLWQVLISQSVDVVVRNIRAYSGVGVAYSVPRQFAEVKSLIRAIVQALDPQAGGISFAFGSSAKTFYLGGSALTPGLMAVPDWTCYDYLNEIAGALDLVWGRGLNNEWYFHDKLSWIRQRRLGQQIDLEALDGSTVISSKLGVNRLTFAYSNSDPDLGFDSIMRAERGAPENAYSISKDLSSRFSCPYDSRSSIAVISGDSVEDSTFLISSSGPNPENSLFVIASDLLSEFQDVELRTTGEVEIEVDLMDKDSLYVASATFPYAFVRTPIGATGFLHARQVEVDLFNDTMKITATRFNV